jgi:hypothetical protein
MTGYIHCVTGEVCVTCPAFSVEWFPNMFCDIIVQLIKLTGI